MVIVVALGDFLKDVTTAPINNNNNNNFITVCKKKKIHIINKLLQHEQNKNQNLPKNKIFLIYLGET